MSRTWVPQQFGLLPEQMKEDRLWELTRKLRGHVATIEDKEELIKGHLRLMISILGTIMHNYSKTIMDDMIGEAALALTEAVNDAENRLIDDNITAYIVSSIIYKVKNALTKLSVMGMPVRTIRYKLNKGINKHEEKLTIAQEDLELISKSNQEELRKVPFHLQASLLPDATTLSDIEFKDLIKNTIFENLPIPRKGAMLATEEPKIEESDSIYYHIPKAKYDMPSVEFLEIMWKSSETPLQKAIMKMRMEGFTYREIGEVVGFSTVRVGEIVNDMEKRFDYYWKL